MKCYAITLFFFAISQNPVGYSDLFGADVGHRVIHLMTCKSVWGQKWKDGSTHVSRQTQPHGDKQSHTPGVQEACSGIEGKCQAKHTSMEERRRCQGVLMQPAWCFSNEDMLYTVEKTQGTQTRGGEAQTITQRISPTVGIKQKKTKAGPNREDDSWLKGVVDSLYGPERLWRECHIYKLIFVHFLTFISLHFFFFLLQVVIFQLLTFPATVQPDQWGLNWVTLQLAACGLGTAF